MIARVVLGILIGYLLIAYFPLVLRGLPYIFLFSLVAIGIYSLRAAPILAEPLGYGLLIVLLCYTIFLVIKHRGNLQALVQNLKNKKIKLPTAKIDGHPQITILLNLILYTIALTFFIYLLILIICVH